MPVDNQMYDRLSHTWWEDDGFLNVLKSGLNPSRFGYMRRILTEELGRDPQGLRVLDVGCGGGSRESLEVARAHALEEGLEIYYREATGEALPFADGEFPAVYCCDVREHVDDVGRTVAEIARVLEPEGVFLYDTINRTRRSRLVMIKVAQFIRPEDIEAHLERAGLHVRDRVGFAAANPGAGLKAMWGRAHGKITYRVKRPPGP